MLFIHSVFLLCSFRSYILLHWREKLSLRRKSREPSSREMHSTINICYGNDATQSHSKKIPSSKFTELQKNINLLINMDDIKLVTRNEKELETLIQAIIINSEDIGLEFGMGKCAMLIMRKRQITEGIIIIHAASTDIPDPLSPLLPIVHRLWQVLRAISRILT